MAKITRKKLAKGTKLQAQPIDNFESGVNQALNEQGVDAENLSIYESSYRLNWWIPQLRYGNAPVPSSIEPPPDPIQVQQWWSKTQVFNFPFVLPATQDIWTTGINEQSKYHTLKDITMTIDQGDEPINWIVAPDATAPTGYNTFAPTMYESNTRDFEYFFRLTLWAKTPNVVNNNITIWEDEIGSWEIPYTAFINESMGFNPYVIPDLNIKLSPDKSYCFSLYFEGTPRELELIIDNEEVLAYWDQYFKNIQFSFRFLTPLRQFDEETGTFKEDPVNVQNYPFTYKDGVDGTTTINTLSPNAVISAAPFQQNIETIDHAFQHKLQGGHNTLWSKPFAAQQTDLAAYDVITLQLFNNYSSQRFYGYDVNELPYYVKVPATFPEEPYITQVADRRAVAIYEPFTIHSIYLGFQKQPGIYGSPSFFAHDQIAANSNFSGVFDFELVMHSGWRSDRYATQQIATLQIDGDDITPYLVDKAIDPILQRKSQSTAAGVGDPTILLYQVPINGSQPLRNIGFYDQGLPYYIGRGIGYNSDDRTFVTDSAFTLAAPKTLGQEKLLEARLRLNGFVAQEYSRLSESGFIYTGSGLFAPGITIYLVVKKSLVKSEW